MKTWLAVDAIGTERIIQSEGVFFDEYSEWRPWFLSEGNIELPNGSIEKLIGRKLTWKDNPVELK